MSAETPPQADTRTEEARLRWIRALWGKQPPAPVRILPAPPPPRKETAE